MHAARNNAGGFGSETESKKPGQPSKECHYCQNVIAFKGNKYMYAI